MAHTNYHLIPTGSEQSERLSTALKEGYFNVDEMSFEDLLAASTTSLHRSSLLTIAR